MTYVLKTAVNTMLGVAWERDEYDSYEELYEVVLETLARMEMGDVEGFEVETEE